LVRLIAGSMLEGQAGIKVRAFLAFNGDNALATAGNLEFLKERGDFVITDDTIYPVSSLD